MFSADLQRTMFKGKRWNRLLNKLSIKASLAAKPKPNLLNLPKQTLKLKAFKPSKAPRLCTVLGGSWDLVSTVISTLSGVISNYKYSYLNYNPSY